MKPMTPEQVAKRIKDERNTKNPAERALMKRKMEAKRQIEELEELKDIDYTLYN